MQTKGDMKSVANDDAAKPGVTIAIRLALGMVGQQLESMMTRIGGELEGSSQGGCPRCRSPPKTEYSIQTICSDV
jgi:hypothetical protein